MEQLLLLYIEPVTKNEHAPCEVLCCSKLAGVFFSVIM